MEVFYWYLKDMMHLKDIIIIDEKLPTDLAFLTNFSVKFNTSSVSSFELKTLCSTEHCFHLTDFCSKNAAAQKEIIAKS